MTSPSSVWIVNPSGFVARLSSRTPVTVRCFELPVRSSCFPQCSNTVAVHFDNTPIPMENVLGEVNQGVRVLMSGLNTERLVLSGGPIGLMQAALDIALPYARERKQFGEAIGSFGDMLIDVVTSSNSSKINSSKINSSKI